MSKPQKASPPNLESLGAEYRSLNSTARSFSEELIRQIDGALSKKNITLGVPIQSRVKDWDSVAEKIERKSLTIETVHDLPDLIGIRLILLFERDVKTACEVLSSTFSILSQENTQERLGDSQFGYASIHFIAEMPEEWLSLPTLTNFSGFHAEIQVRTVAQHIWAAASHSLQYKNEANVPLPVRRAINRVSALLETVDLELERVLEQRDTYSNQVDDDDLLNADSLQSVLDDLLPMNNKRSTGENYSDLLEDLFNFSINTKRSLIAILEKNYKKIMEDEELKAKSGASRSRERRELGVFYSHAGLVRVALSHEFGAKWDSYNTKAS